MSMPPHTAMILAAGRGTRLRPLTLTTPKPLLEVAGRPLIEHHLQRLAALGVRRVVINLHHLGDQLRERLGDGSRWQLELVYSPEPELLETAGGIRQALDLLGPQPFLLLNGDVFLDFDLARLLSLPEQTDAHLLLITRPAWQQRGDFAWMRPDGTPSDEVRPEDEDHGLIQLLDDGPLTYAGVGLFHPRLFQHLTPGFRPLRPLLATAAACRRLTGQLHQGLWEDVGTVERLRALRARLETAAGTSS